MWETHPNIERSRTVGREFESRTKDEEVLFYLVFHSKRLYDCSAP